MACKVCGELLFVHHTVLDQSGFQAVLLLLLHLFVQDGDAHGFLNVRLGNVLSDILGQEFVDGGAAVRTVVLLRIIGGGADQLGACQRVGNVLPEGNVFLRVLCGILFLFLGQGNAEFLGIGKNAQRGVVPEQLLVVRIVKCVAGIVAQIGLAIAQIAVHLGCITVCCAAA